MSRALVLLAAALIPGAWAQSPVPRPAPEFRIAELSGRSTLLSSLRGRITVLAFISTECVHCQRASVVFERLSHEFSAKLQVLEVAFNEGADPAAFARRFGLTFPVGTSSSAEVHRFLGIPAGERLGTPQVVVIDSKGIIRAQSERLGTPLLQTPEYLPSLIRALLKRELMP